MNDIPVIPIGEKATESVTVTRELTVAHFAEGMPEVYGTPLMIYLMEAAAAKAILPYLPPGWASVGTEVCIKHLAGTPLGFLVTATATVTSVSGRTVTYDVRAHDGVELIGQGTHSRSMIELERFNSRMGAKSRASGCC